ncbi:MAG TPA: NosD domain-containing protein [Bacteroidales bacterium]|nr:NosD domain-containing protein [Bacteroidales bacterium]
MRSLFFVLSLLVANCIVAAEFTVTNTLDSGPGSLRQAITDAQASPGSNTVLFAIPTSDANYNSTSEHWVISLNSALPYIVMGNLTIDATSQTGYLGTPKLAITTSSPSTVLWAFGIFSSNNNIKGFLVYGFANGILISEPGVQNNNISQCYLGTDVSGTYAIGNQNAVVINNQASDNNVFDCLISGNTNGFVCNNASQNQIYDCYFGVNYLAAGALPNTNGIVLDSGSHSNLIRDNVISGNTSAGILISKSNQNQIKGNKIGTDISGLSQIANENGLMIDSSINNIIGGENINDRNIISGNNQSGIVISGRTSTQNQILGNYIGTDLNGEAKLSNLYGIAITKAFDNIIGPDNLISGNTDIGVLLTGKYTRLNRIEGNIIGTDVSGTQLLDNHKGIVIKSLANSNFVGGNTAGQRNIISGNLEIGIYIEASDSNKVTGNYIGVDISGMNKVAVAYTQPYYEHLDSLVQGNGIEFNATAKHNILGGDDFGERNVVSGHKVYGVVYYGNCSYNHLYNNFIGTDATSQNAVPNATGICFDCASNHNDVVNCVISGNLSYGLFYVTRGTEYNRFWGNMVGVDSTGTVAVPNDIGIVVSTGTAHNIIGGEEPWQANVFSGNRLSGMMITNGLTEYNQVKGNYFGTDKTGTIAVPNLYGITITTFTKHNIIEGNLISGNTMSGIILYEHADSNRIVNNKIGTDINLNPLGNGNGGIYVDQGASFNTIGEVENPNIIAHNSNAGILVKHELTQNNRVSGNLIYQNDGLGIDIFPFGMVNDNDNGDWDDGAASLMNFPVINSIIYNPESENAHVSGVLDSQYPQNCIVEIYTADESDFEHGQANAFVGLAYPDQYGNWSLTTDALDESDVVTVIAISEEGNTSEFSLNFDDIILSAESDFAFDNIEIGPMPASNFFTINANDQIEDYFDFCIYDISGSLIFSQNNCIGETLVDITDKTLYKEGKYILVIKTSGGISVAKNIMIVR